LLQGNPGVLHGKCLIVKSLYFEPGDGTLIYHCKFMNLLEQTIERIVLGFCHRIINIRSPCVLMVVA
jgi:hypothetical protein